VSTQLSGAAAPPTEPAPPAAGHPPAGSADGTRSTSWRLYAALALGSLVLAALSLLYPSTPSYDPWGWLLWGREILHLDLNTRGANSFKPLPVLFTLPFALFGKAQPDLWLVLARAGALFGLAMAFKLAASITIWFGAGPAGRRGAARWVAYGPAILAGVVAAVSLLLSTDFVRDVSLGYSEGMAVGLMLLAIDRHLDDKPRQAFIVGFFPALDRPEIWPFWGLYGLYLWRRDPGARKLVLSLFALVPVLWFGTEYWGSGQFFRGVNHALHPQSGQATYKRCPFCSEMKQASQVVLSRVKLVAGLTALGAAFAVWRALRRRKADLRAAVREQAHRPEGIVLVLAITALLWFIEISTMTQMGFGGNQRYLIMGGALVVVVGGVGWGVAAWKLGELLGRWSRPTGGAAAAVAIAAAVFLLLPSWVGVALKAGKLNRALHYQAALRQDLGAIVQRAGGAKAVLACGKVETENYQVQMVAWYLGVPGIEVSDEMPPAVAMQAANVILQTRKSGTAGLRPLIPAGVRYTEITDGAFNLYERCR
jgi:hypothetical protein